MNNKKNNNLRDWWVYLIKPTLQALFALGVLILLGVLAEWVI